MDDTRPDDWWKEMPFSGEEFWGEDKCPWNPFPPGSDWGDDLDRAYRRRMVRRRLRAWPYCS